MHSIATSPGRERAPSPLDPASTQPPSRVIEFGEVTAGIVVPEHGGVRFFSSDPDFDGLDGTQFRSAEQAARAARGRTRAARS